MGTLSSKKKPDLQEIAGALNLSEDGTREVLIMHVNEFFKQNLDLCEVPQFSGLFNHASKWQAPVAEDLTSNTPKMQHFQSDAYQPLSMNILNVCGTTPGAGPSTFC